MHAYNEWVKSFPKIESLIFWAVIPTTCGCCSAFKTDWNSTPRKNRELCLGYIHSRPWIVEACVGCLQLWSLLKPILQYFNPEKESEAMDAWLGLKQWLVEGWGILGSDSIQRHLGGTKGENSSFVQTAGIKIAPCNLGGVLWKEIKLQLKSPGSSTHTHTHTDLVTQASICVIEHA